MTARLRLATAFAALCVAAAPLSAWAERPFGDGRIVLAQADAAKLKERADLLFKEIRKAGAKVEYAGIEAGAGPDSLTVKGLTITGPGGDPVKVAALEVKSYDWANGAEARFGDISIKGIDIPLDDKKGEAKGDDDFDPKSLGYERLTANADLAFKFDEKAKTVELSKLELEIADFGALKFTFKLGGLTLESLKKMTEDAPGGDAKKKEEADMALLTQLTLVGGTVSFKEKGILARLVKAQAAKKKISEADARAAILKDIMDARGEAQDAFSKEMIDAAAKFFQTGGEIELKLAPKEPATIMAAAMLLFSEPGKIKEMFGVSIAVK